METNGLMSTRGIARLSVGCLAYRPPARSPPVAYGLGQHTHTHTHTHEETGNDD